VLSAAVVEILVVIDEFAILDIHRISDRASTGGQNDALAALSGITISAVIECDLFFCSRSGLRERGCTGCRTQSPHS